jgi:hypothetical protein
MMLKTIKLVTARGVVYEDGKLYDVGMVERIAYQFGDPQDGIPGGYMVFFNGGLRVEVCDIVEAWERPMTPEEKEAEENRLGTYLGN